MFHLVVKREKYGKKEENWYALQKISHACMYVQKMHAWIKERLQLGINVHY